MELVVLVGPARFRGEAGDVLDVGLEHLHEDEHGRAQQPAQFHRGLLDDQTRVGDPLLAEHLLEVAPVEDRDAPGKGFTHKTGDIVTIASPKLGKLVNRIRPTDHCERWTFGTAALMRNLARRGLI